MNWVDVGTGGTSITLGDPVFVGNEVLFIGHGAASVLRILSFNVKNQTWNAKYVDAKGVSNRIGHGMATVANSIYIFGGQSHELEETYVQVVSTISQNDFSMRLGIAETLSPCARIGLTSCTFGPNNEHIAVFGGSCEDGSFSDELWVYSPFAFVPGTPPPPVVAEGEEEGGEAPVEEVPTFNKFRWKKIECSGEKPPARAFHSMAVMGDKNQYLVIYSGEGVTSSKNENEGQGDDDNASVKSRESHRRLLGGGRGNGTGTGASASTILADLWVVDLTSVADNLHQINQTLIDKQNNPEPEVVPDPKAKAGKGKAAEPIPSSDPGDPLEGPSWTSIQLPSTVGGRTGTRMTPLYVAEEGGEQQSMNLLIYDGGVAEHSPSMYASQVVVHMLSFTNDMQLTSTVSGEDVFGKEAPVVPMQSVVVPVASEAVGGQRISSVLLCFLHNTFDVPTTIYAAPIAASRGYPQKHATPAGIAPTSPLAVKLGSSHIDEPDPTADAAAMDRDPDLPRKLIFTTFTYDDGGHYEGYMAPTPWDHEEGDDDGKIHDHPHKLLPHTAGKFTYADGWHFDGNFEMGSRHGRGVLMQHNKSKRQSDLTRLDGTFDRNRFIEGTKSTKDYKETGVFGRVENGAKHSYELNGTGEIEMFRDNARGKKGQVYKGEFDMGKRHGKGELIDTITGVKLEGDWENDSFDGKGARTEKDGTRLEGSFVNGEAVGDGTKKYADGSFYEGQFAKGKRNGMGTQTFENGDHYSGKWILGKMQGKGTLKRADGTVYSGVFKNDLPEGQGEERTADDCYSGDFKNGLRDGNGVRIYPMPNGDVYHVLYEKGVLTKEVNEKHTDIIHGSKHK